MPGPESSLVISKSFLAEFLWSSSPGEGTAMSFFTDITLSSTGNYVGTTGVATITYVTRHYSDCIFFLFCTYLITKFVKKLKAKKTKNSSLIHKKSTLFLNFPIFFCKKLMRVFLEKLEKNVSKLMEKTQKVDHFRCPRCRKSV